MSRTTSKAADAPPSAFDREYAVIGHYPAWNVTRSLSLDGKEQLKTQRPPLMPADLPVEKLTHLYYGKVVFEFIKLTVQPTQR